MTGFESRKVRALLTYLVCQRDRAFTREHLASLFWPEKSGDAARRNLRQALYNLKTVLASRDDESPILTQQGSLQIAPTVSFWLDVAAFEDALALGAGLKAINPHHLAGAARLYQGAFLADFPLREDSPFDDWLSAERSRLQEAAVGVLRMLVESYLSRGEYRLGIQYAQRLVALDPLSEEGHRYLMRLYASAGRRGRAIRHYQDLEALLKRELDVEPVEETNRLFQQILTEESPVVIDGDESDPIGPVIPLVGRADALTTLGRHWQRVTDSGARVTLIVGEAGVGKTRLARAFLDVATSQDAVTVVMGSCAEKPPMVYQPFQKIIRRAIDETVAMGDGFDAISSEVLAELSLLVPDLVSERPDLPSPTTRAGDPTPLFEALTTLLGLLLKPATASGPASGAPRPVIVYLDDLDWAGPETTRLMRHLLDRLQDQPIWFVATASTETPLLEHVSDSTDVVRLERLDVGAVEEIASSIVAGDQRSDLVSLLVEHRHGLPMGIAEMINFLWDEKALVTDHLGHWRLDVGTNPALLAGVENIGAMINRRLHRLPSSTRRLATLAAAIGQEFQPELVRHAAREHVAVVDIGMEVLLERWLVRPYAELWASSGSQPNGPARHTRQGRFDFTHRYARRAIYESISPARRCFIHRQIIDAMEEIHGTDAGLHCELLAHHCLEAKAWNRARTYLELTIRKAEATSAVEIARECRARLDELAAQQKAGAATHSSSPSL